MNQSGQALPLLHTVQRKVVRTSPWLLLLLGLLTFSACNKQVLLDNPSANTYIVSINEMDYVVNPDTGMYVPVPLGNCTLNIAFPDGTVEYEGTVEITNSGLLNLTRTAYVIEEELYVDQTQNRNEYMSNINQVKKISVRGTDIIGAFEYHPASEIFIEKEWDFDAMTPLPDQVSLAQFNSFAVKRKIWRESEFWSDYQTRDTCRHWRMESEDRSGI